MDEFATSDRDVVVAHTAEKRALYFHNLHGVLRQSAKTADHLNPQSQLQLESYEEKEGNKVISRNELITVTLEDEVELSILQRLANSKTGVMYQVSTVYRTDKDSGRGIYNIYHRSTFTYNYDRSGWFEESKWIDGEYVTQFAMNFNPGDMLNITAFREIDRSTNKIVARTK